MKKQTLTSFLVLFALILGPSPVRAGESYRLILDGLTQSSEGALHFDLFLENTGAAFYLNDVHAVVRFNPGITGGGSFDAEEGLLVVAGSSELLYPPAGGDFVLSPGGDAFVLTTPEPELNMPAQEVAPGALLRVATLSVILFHEGRRGVFTDMHPGFFLCEDESRVRHCPADAAGLKTGAGVALGGGELHCHFGDRPLASRYFYGAGCWHATDGEKALHWNIHPDTHADFARQLPDTHNNVVIGGMVTIAEGQQVQLHPNEKGEGGTLIIETASKPTYRIHLVANGEGVSVQLYDMNLSPLPNPNDVYEGSRLTLFSMCSSVKNDCNFINWTDQNGQVIGIYPYLGPFIMPATHTTLTANWTSGVFDKAERLAADKQAAASLFEASGQRNAGEEACDFPGLEGLREAGELYSGLIIAPGGALTVERLLNRHDRGGEALVLQSHEGGDAAGSLIHGNEGVAVTVERYIGRRPEGNTYRGWHLLSSPVQQMPLQPAFVPEPRDGVLPDWFDFYRWDESHVEVHNEQTLTGWWINVKAHGGAWNEAFEHDFLSGRGYLVSYGDPGAERDVPGETYGDRAHRFTGSATVEDVLAGGLTHTAGGDYAGWHLLGNPFTSALLWSPGAWPQSGILGGPLLWHEGNAGYVPVIDIIPAMNGFMIQSSGDGHLMIPAGARVHHGPGWHKSGQRLKGDSGLTPHIRLTAIDGEGGTAQESVVLFRREATHAYDPRYDTPFMPGYAPHFYSLSGGTPLMLNSLPSDACVCPGAPESHRPAENMLIPFGFRKNASDRFEIALLEKPEGVFLGLEDSFTGQLHPLDTDRPYAFVSAEGDPAARFVLHILTEGSLGGGKGLTKDRLRVYARNNTLTVFTTGEHTFFQLMDMQGRIVAAQRLSGAGSHSIGVELPHGVYLVRLRTENEEVREKVVW